MNHDWMASVRSLENPVMGTESVGPLLYWLMRGCRPRQVLEVGGGSTTLYLARANLDNRHAFAREREALLAKCRAGVPFDAAWYQAPPVLADPAFYVADYAPRLLSVDRRPEDDPGMVAVQRVLREWETLDDVDFASEDFMATLARLHEQRRTFDFVWFDCGGYREYADFIEHGWPLVDPAGGMLVLHYTLTNLAMGAVVKELKLRQATGGLRDFELVSVLEPHKFAQNSFTIIRKTAAYRERIYEHPDVTMLSDITRLLMQPPA